MALPGQVGHADLPALYQIATVYAHSSNYEGFGVVLAEAAAAGLPVVSTDTDGAREIVEDGVDFGVVRPAEGGVGPAVEEIEDGVRGL